MNLDFNFAPSQEQYKPSVLATNPIKAFQNKLAKHGLAPEHIIADSTLQRFNIDRRKDLAGWYVLHSGQFYGGMFGNWITGDRINWCSAKTEDMSDAESAEYRRIIQAASEQRKKEKKRLQGLAQKKAESILKKAVTVINHDYLKAKNVKSYNLKQDGKNLIIPAYDVDGILRTLQTISASGKKKFLFGGKIKGCFHTIPGKNDHFYICEGYATGASIHEATGETIIIAFNAGNLKPVAKGIRSKTTKNITICADNDQWTPGNPGVMKAKSAAREVSANIVTPIFKNIDNRPTDFNDLAILSGLDTVKKQISMPSKKQAFPPFLSQDTQVSKHLRIMPSPIKFVVKYDNQGLIPEGIVGVLTATGGTGKSFFLLQLAYMLAGGYNLGNIRAIKPTRTLYIAGEDTQDEINRRLWNIGNGTFPSHLHACSIYGEVGPLMRLNGNIPERADGFKWLEATIKNHKRLEVLILDPKSRMYGLDENNSDHATQWIQCIEYLSKKYEITILFSHHTSKTDGAKISQNMSRGSSAIVDGCRWQAGLVRMDDMTAGKLGIEHPRLYVEFNAPKSNYAPDIPQSVFFKRNEYGILEPINVKSEGIKIVSKKFLAMLKSDPQEYSTRELHKSESGKDFCEELKSECLSFNRKKIPELVSYLIEKGSIEEVKKEDTFGKGRQKSILKIVKKTPF